MDMSFGGFTSESFSFFRELAHHNAKPWFDQNRPRYEAHVQGVFRGLLQTLEPALLNLNPNFEISGKTNKSFSRINRDIRFSKDKSPYKSNYYLYVYDSRRQRDMDGRLYVGLSADCVTVGFAIYATWGKGPKGTLETVFRPRFQKEGARLRRLIDTVVRKKRYETYWHRQEKGEWILHPACRRGKRIGSRCRPGSCARCLNLARADSTNQGSPSRLPKSSRNYTRFIFSLLTVCGEISKPVILRSPAPGDDEGSLHFAMNTNAEILRGVYPELKYWDPSLRSG